jgi:RNA polymerase sigma factor (sigma-70 family)
MQLKTTPMLEATDEALFHAWLDGDAAAGQALVRRHYRRILLFFYTRVGPEVGKDLTQATFETLCTNKVSFRGDSTLLTYLFGIARWKLVDYFRTRRTNAERFEPLSDPGHVVEIDRSITSLFMDRQQETLVVQALRSLPLDDQIILELKQYENLSSAQLAAMYGVGRDTMSSRINRARKRLAAAVAERAQFAHIVDSTLTGLDEYMRQIRDCIAAAADGDGDGDRAR